MATRRKSIKVASHDRELLIKLYRKRRIPVDRYESKPEELRSLTDEWNILTGRTDEPSDLFHYMRSQRKRGLWVTLDGDYDANELNAEMTAEEVEVLIEIYYENVSAAYQGSDVIGYDGKLADLIADEFAERTGRRISSPELLTKITAIRKRGLLPKAEKPPEESGRDGENSQAE